MRAFAFIFGIIFLVIGIAGFVPNFVVKDHLIEVFHVNTWLNVIHTTCGILAFIAGLWNRFISRLYFQIIGVVFAILALLGFIFEERDIFGIIANNGPDTWFHVILAIAALILGYGSRD